MTVEFIDNFMSYRTIDDMQPVYELNDPGAETGSNLVLIPGNGPTTVPQQPQSSRVAPPTLSFLGNSNTGGGNATEVRLALPVTQEKIFAFHFRPVAGEGNTSSQADTVDEIFATYDDTNFQVCMNIEIHHAEDLFNQPEGGGCLIYLRRSASTDIWDSFNDRDTTIDVPGMTDGLMAYGEWYYIELRIFAAVSTGIVELRINGVQVYLATGMQTTIGQDNIGFIEFRSGEASGSSSYGSGLAYDIADLIVIDRVTGFDEFPFPAIISRLQPDAEVVGEIDFTPETGTDNSAMVDDAPHDYDTTFNESTTATHKDRFTTGDVIPYASLGEVLGVKVEAIVKDTLDLGTRTARVVVFENATEGVGATRTLTDTPYQPIYDVFSDNPDTSLPWTKAEVAAAEFGYEIVT